MQAALIASEYLKDVFEPADARRDVITHLKALSEK